MAKIIKVIITCCHPEIDTAASRAGSRFVAAGQSSASPPVKLAKPAFRFAPVYRTQPGNRGAARLKIIITHPTGACGLGKNVYQSIAAHLL